MQSRYSKIKPQSGHLHYIITSKYPCFIPKLVGESLNIRPQLVTLLYDFVASLDYGAGLKAWLPVAGSLQKSSLSILYGFYYYLCQCSNIALHSSANLTEVLTLPHYTKKNCQGYTLNIIAINSFSFPSLTQALEAYADACIINKL